jgi:hypothetical protein
MTIDTRIARTGYVIRYPEIESLGEPERWYLCDAHGIIATRGTVGFNAVTCREMVERGALVEHRRRGDLQTDGGASMTTQTKERPIIFSGPMVRAILEGSKTQTRRVVKGDWFLCLDFEDDEDRARAVEMCPYGKAGDATMWVRETFCVGYGYETGKFTALPFHGCENTRKAFYRATDDDAPDEPKRPWKPSIHMPRWASRITLEIVSVRVERVQDISAGDICAEGVDCVYEPNSTTPSDHYNRQMWVRLWDTINAGRGYAWNVNPWVWVIEFKQVTP